MNDHMHEDGEELTPEEEETISLETQAMELHLAKINHPTFRAKGIDMAMYLSCVPMNSAATEHSIYF